MKIKLQTIADTVKHRKDIFHLFRILSSREFNGNFTNGRHLLWLRPTKPGLFVPNSTVPIMATILSKHYHLIKEKLTRTAIYQLSTERGILIYHNEKTPSIKIYLTVSSPNNKEAEMLLNLYDGDVKLFRLGFVIVDENTIFNSNRIGILITLLQGYVNQKDLNCKVKKAFGDISLDRILFSSLIGFARHLEIDTIYGIPYQFQYAFRKYASRSCDNRHLVNMFLNAYDKFYGRFQYEIKNNYFCISLPLQHKLYDSAKSLSHRKRSDRRRIKNEEVSTTVYKNIVFYQSNESDLLSNNLQST